MVISNIGGMVNVMFTVVYLLQSAWIGFKSLSMLTVAQFTLETLSTYYKIHCILVC